MASRRWRTASAVGLALLITASACNRDKADGEGTSSSTPPSAAAGSPLPRPTGPLAGATWPGPSAIGAGELLHDDSESLAVLDLKGQRREVWRHPKADVTALAIAPDGKSLAMAAFLAPQRPEEQSSVLYLLRPDGSIQTVDAVTGFRTIESLTFLAPPKLGRTAQLHWLRFTSELDRSRGRAQSEVMRLDGDTLAVVDVPLRHGEGVAGFDGYPGSNRWTVTLVRQVDEPTRFTTLTNTDANNLTTSGGPETWSSSSPRADSDGLIGTAWLSPSDYLVLDYDATFPDRRTLRHYRVGCEFRGAHVVPNGAGLDAGQTEVTWRLLPVSGTTALGLTTEDVKRIGGGGQGYWSLVALDGVHPSPVGWAPGAWASLSRTAAPMSHTTCDELTYGSP